MAAPDGIARRITKAFSRGEFRLKKPGAPVSTGWHAVPEIFLAEELRAWGADDVAVRHFISFTAALDRSRDADALWKASTGLFKREPWLYQPKEVSTRPFVNLQALLKESKISRDMKSTRRRGGRSE